MNSFCTVGGKHDAVGWQGKLHKLVLSVTFERLPIDAAKADVDTLKTEKLDRLGKLPRMRLE